MARYIHVATGKEVEARQFEARERWQIPGSTPETITGSNGQWKVYPTEEVDKGEWEVAYLGQTLLYPRLAFPMLFAPAAPSVEIQPEQPPPPVADPIPLATSEEPSHDDYFYPGDL